MLPYQQDGARLARLLASCDALVHAGRHETFGMNKQNTTQAAAFMAANTCALSRWDMSRPAFFSAWT